MSEQIHNLIESLDSRHAEAQSILHDLADGKKIKPADIDGLNSRFVQVAPLLHDLNNSNSVTQADIDALDSFVGTRLRLVLGDLAARRRVQKSSVRPAGKKHKRTARKK